VSLWSTRARGSSRSFPIATRCKKRLSQTLVKKLGDKAEFTFIDAPLELPLEDGQEVAMRSWWHSAHSSGDVKDAVAAVQVRARAC
jgi:hypothetical protein